MDTKQVHRLFALYESIKKLPNSRHEEGLEKAKEWLVDNNCSLGKDPIVSLGKIKSRYKIDALKQIVENKEDYYELYKSSWIKDKDIIHYLGIDKIKK